MFNVLQPTSLVPYRPKMKKQKPVPKPAVVISIKNEAAPDFASNNNNNIEDEPLPFQEWKMPEQGREYLRPAKHNIL